MLMEAETSTPTARPCMASLTKMKILRRGLMDAAATISHTASHKKAPTTRAFFLGWGGREAKIG
jgi:hypothetical protein